MSVSLVERILDNGEEYQNGILKVRIARVFFEGGELGKRSQMHLHFDI